MVVNTCEHGAPLAFIEAARQGAVLQSWWCHTGGPRAWALLGVAAGEAHHRQARVHSKALNTKRAQRLILIPTRCMRKQRLFVFVACPCGHGAARDHATDVCRRARPP